MVFNKENTAKRLEEFTSGKPQRKRHRILISLRLLLAALLLLFAAALAIGVGFIHAAIRTAPSLDLLHAQPPGYSSSIYDANGTLTQTLVMSGSNRQEVSYDQLPQDLVNAFIAIEDSRFRQHNGVDTRSVLRAIYIGLTTGSFSEGGSTITQQLVKNNILFGGNETGFLDRVRRKLQEQYLALQLEQQLGNKNIILEYYLNTINLGSNCLGVQVASQRYFGKNVWDLTLSESAVLAAATSNPYRYNPITHPSDNALRREIVLEKMYEQGFITKIQQQEALADNVYARIQAADSIDDSTAPVFSYFTDAVFNQVCNDLQDRLGYTASQANQLLYSGGLQIYTTMDSEIQKIVDEEVNNSANYISASGSVLEEYSLNYSLSILHEDGTQTYYNEKDITAYYQAQLNQPAFRNLYTTKEDIYRTVRQFKSQLLKEQDQVLNEVIEPILQPQTSVVVMDQKTGHVLAISGGRGEKTGSLTLNRATSSSRQPGSALTIPAVYAPALDVCGATLGTTYYDSPYSVGQHQVVNWWGTQYLGYNTIRQAITYSMNVAAVRCLTQQTTPAMAYSYLEKFGITTLTNADRSTALALGSLTYGVRNQELTAAYAAIADDGIYHEPIYYTRVLDRQGNILLDNTPTASRIIKSTTAALLTEAMEDVISSDSGQYYQYGLSPTGAACRIDGLTLAGKSGTTTSANDLWFVGFSPLYTCGIWSGYDDPKSFGSGTDYHKIIWQKIMTRIHKNKTDASFAFSDTLETAVICSKSGLLAINGICDASDSNASVYTESFAPGTAPTEFCDHHYVLRICQSSGKSATEYCPDHSVVQKVYLRIHDDNLQLGNTIDSDYLAPSNLQSCDIHTAGEAKDSDTK